MNNVNEYMTEGQVKALRKRPSNVVFPEANDCIEDESCPICNEMVNVNDFEKQDDIKEYQTSGICKPCQDRIFK